MLQSPGDREPAGPLPARAQADQRQANRADDHRPDGRLRESCLHPGQLQRLIPRTTRRSPTSPPRTRRPSVIADAGHAVVDRLNDVTSLGTEGKSVQGSTTARARMTATIGVAIVSGKGMIFDQAEPTSRRRARRSAPTAVRTASSACSRAERQDGALPRIDGYLLLRAAGRQHRSSCCGGVVHRCRPAISTSTPTSSTRRSCRRTRRCLRDDGERGRLLAGNEAGEAEERKLPSLWQKSQRLRALWM